MCVGAKVGVEGDVTGTTVAAADVFVLPAHRPSGHDGNGVPQGATHHFAEGLSVPKGNNRRTEPITRVETTDHGSGHERHATTG